METEEEAGVAGDTGANAGVSEVELWARNSPFTGSFELNFQEETGTLSASRSRIALH